MKQVVVVGGGLAGLSGAFHLREFEPRLFEREDTVGGVCRSFCQDGFTFDVTGHLLHLKNDYTQGLVDRLLPAVFQPYERRAAIYSKKKITPYPFQANTYGLPPEVVRECLIGFIESLDVDHGQPDNFQDWILHTFGSGIARHFMLPFNEKFWKVDLREITADWVSWSIPKPTLEEVVDGALGLENKGMGYNPRFYYPKSGGIDCLPHALARHLQHVYTGHDLEAIDGENRVVRFSNGRQETYECLLATIPLPIVFELLDDAPDRLREAARKLRAISVLDINVGVDRPSISDKHWIYFPEPEFVFSRVGFPTNFSKDAAPEGTSSMYIEVTHPPRDKPDVEVTYQRALSNLRTCGILREDDSILTRNVIDVRYAYVIFDRHRRKHLPELIEYLESRDIFTAGRYGEWDYYSMEDSILSGKAAAERIAKRIGVTPTRQRP